MSDLQVRPAAPSDFEAVAALLAELGRPAVTEATREGLLVVYLRHIGRPDTASMVAEADGSVVGFISLEFRERLNWQSIEAWVPDLIVTAGTRSTGAGKALLQAAIAAARARGCHRISLESGYSREVAHRFYALQGMTDAGKFFTLKL